MTSHLIITGAGFSVNAGLPLASDFTAALLQVKGLKLDGPSRRMVKHVRAFVDATFGNGGVTTAQDWPALEDIFTLIDLSANSGHHLGPTYSAAALRTIRRALIVRLIRMLQRNYVKAEEKPGENWKALELFLRRLNLENTAVLSLNWDTVFEQGLGRTQGVDQFDYGCDAHAAIFEGDKVNLRKNNSSRTIELLKPHGSINWLYCDACREIFWFPPNRIEKIAQTLFRARDWKAVDQAIDEDDQPATLDPPCPLCDSYALGTRIATFSYRKALDFPMHAATWRRAEMLLREADTWLFFGYSMPAADFEFKHLLKRVELSRRSKPNVVVVTGGKAAKLTELTYRNFFGPSGDAPRNYYCEGLTHTLLDDLTQLNILRPPERKRNSRNGKYRL